MRKTIAAVELESGNGSSASGEGVAEGLGGVVSEDRGGSSGHDALKDARVVIDMDRVRGRDCRPRYVASQVPTGRYTHNAVLLDGANELLLGSTSEGMT